MSFAGEGHKEAKARAKAQKGLGMAKIVGLSKLRSKFESHEAKRQLCASYDLFLADERVIPSLPKLLGSRFRIFNKSFSCFSAHLGIIV